MTEKEMTEAFDSIWSRVMQCGPLSRQIDWDALERAMPKDPAVLDAYRDAMIERMKRNSPSELTKWMKGLDK